MDHRFAIAEPEQRLDFAAVAAGDAPDLVRAVLDQATAEIKATGFGAGRLDADYGGGGATFSHFLTDQFEPRLMSLLDEAETLAAKVVRGRRMKKTLKVVAGIHWEAMAERRFAQPAHFQDWGEFEQRMLYPSFADHHITPALVARVRAAFDPHCGPDGAHFVRPMHVRVMRRSAATPP